MGQLAGTENNLIGITKKDWTLFC